MASIDCNYQNTVSFETDSPRVCHKQFQVCFGATLGSYMSWFILGNLTIDFLRKEKILTFQILRLSMLAARVSCDSDKVK